MPIILFVDVVNARRWGWEGRPLPRLLFHVSVAGNSLPVYLDSSLGDTYGEFDSDKMEIRVAEHTLASQKLLQETLRHEVFHACLFFSGMTYAMTYDTEEQLVRMADGILWTSVKNAEKSVKNYRKKSK